MFGASSAQVYQERVGEDSAPGGGQGGVHFAELFPEIGFVVTNMETDSRAVLRFYNQRGRAEQWIKEGKPAVKMKRSCDRFRSNEVRLWLNVMVYNLENLWRRLGCRSGLRAGR